LEPHTVDAGSCGGASCTEGVVDVDVFDLDTGERPDRVAEFGDGDGSPLLW